MHKILVLIFFGIVVGIFFSWWINNAYKRKKMRLHQEIRDNVRAERDKQLQEAKDKGDFDKWRRKK